MSDEVQGAIIGSLLAALGAMWLVYFQDWRRRLLRRQVALALFDRVQGMARDYLGAAGPENRVPVSAMFPALVRDLYAALSPEALVEVSPAARYVAPLLQFRLILAQAVDELAIGGDGKVTKGRLRMIAGFSRGWVWRLSRPCRSWLNSLETATAVPRQPWDDRTA